MSVDRLPAEVLVEIFRYCISNPVSTSKTRKRISRVSKTWRRLLYTTRSIWSTIYFECRERFPVGYGPFDSNFDDLDLCLTLSHPLPLDIYIVMDIPSKSAGSGFGYQRPIAHCRALLSLSGHADRWRNFSITGREWVFGYLPPLYQLEHSTSLRSLAVRITNVSSSEQKHHWQGAQVSLPNLTRLETNFSLSVGISRTNLATFTAGFDNIKRCHQILAKTINLTELTLNHVGTSIHDTTLNTSDVLSVTSVRTLRLTKCSLAWVQFFSFPSLESLMLLGQEDVDDNVHISHQERGASGEHCTTSWENETEIIPSLFDVATKAPLQQLGLDLRGLPTMAVHIPLLLGFQDLTTLSVKFDAVHELHLESKNGPPVGRSVSAFFTALLSPAFAPRLESFELFLQYNGKVASDSDFFLCSPLVEQAARKLGRRSGSGIRRFVVARDDPLKQWHGTSDDVTISGVYMASSLYLTLRTLESEGVTTEWWVGNTNLLSQARIPKVRRLVPPALF